MAKFRAAGRFIIINEKEEILVVKHKKNWAIPGGGIYFGEKLCENISREAEEELGVKAEMDKVIFIQDFIAKKKKKKKHCLEYFCSIKNNKDFENILATYKNSTHAYELLDAKWSSINNFPENFLPKNLPKILKKYFENKKTFSCEYIPGI